MTIEAGRWYRRTRDGLVVRAAYLRFYVDGWWVRPVGVDGDACVAAATEDLEPWVPRVGEWVRVGNGSAWRVEVVSEWGAAGRGPTGVYAAAFHAIVPCAPPAEEIARSTAAREVCCEDHERGAAEKHEPCAPPGEALKDTDRDSLKDTPPAVSHRRDDGTRCHRCGGPAYTGLGVGGRQQCLAPRCEPVAELEPTVVQRWTSPGHDAALYYVAAGPRDERIYVAEGYGVSAQHPIRAEAVALWRKKVLR